MRGRRWDGAPRVATCQGGSGGGVCQDAGSVCQDAGGVCQDAGGVCQDGGGVCQQRTWSLPRSCSLRPVACQRRLPKAVVRPRVAQWRSAALACRRACNRWPITTASSHRRLPSVSTAWRQCSRASVSSVCPWAMRCHRRRPPRFTCRSRRASCAVLSGLSCRRACSRRRRQPVAWRRRLACSRACTSITRPAALCAHRRNGARICLCRRLRGVTCGSRVRSCRLRSKARRPATRVPRSKCTATTRCIRQPSWR